jgi:PIN domain nuclease of toxin-antitoxin system
LNLLIDTHILLWQLHDDPRFRKRWREILDDTEREVFVSEVSLWEIAIKVRAGRLDVKLSDVERAVDRLGYRWLALTRAHLRRLMTLPVIHRDPYDHLLLAQADSEDLLLLTQDEEMSRYGVATFI